MNILDLLQQYQQAQKAPSMMGPVPAQNPQPGFRAPPVMQMHAPQQPQGGGLDMGQGIGMMGGMLRGLGSDPTKPGVPTPQGDPTGGAGPAFLGGATSLAPQPDSNGIVAWLHRHLGLF